MRFNLFFVILLAVSIASAASLIGWNDLGMEQAPQNAAIARNGFSPINPAVHAFENRTKFGTTIQFEYATAQKGDEAISLNSFTMPSISMVLPLGFLGAFSVGLEQKFFASNRLELVEPDLNSNVKLTSRVGLYELLPSYSIRLPLALSNFAVGASYRLIFGNSFSTLERGFWEKEGDNDAWIARNIMITERERGNFETTSDWWRNIGYSLHYNRRTVDYFISYFPRVEIENNIRKNIQFSNTDTLKTNKEAQFITLPKRFASGFHLRFLRNQNLSFVYEHQNYEDAAASYFAEYKLSGTGLYYSPFFQRNDFGINAWYAEKYLKDVNEFGGSLFSDMLLGRKGTIVGIAFYGGYRQAKEPYWDEPFFGFRLNLTGVGNWGTSVRRR